MIKNKKKISVSIGMHCCDKMYFYLKEQKVAIGYSPKFRAYYIDIKTSKLATQGIFYCPWCGKKLPKTLDEEYDNELSKIINIPVDDIDLETYHDPNLPEEFKTDEWWKKRGL